MENKHNCIHYMVCGMGGGTKCNAKCWQYIKKQEWTKERPKEDGFYLFKKILDNRKSELYVCEISDGKVYTPGFRHHINQFIDNAEWLRIEV